MCLTSPIKVTNQIIPSSGEEGKKGDERAKKGYMDGNPFSWKEICRGGLRFMGENAVICWVMCCKHWTSLPTCMMDTSNSSPNPQLRVVSPYFNFGLIASLTP